MNGLEKYGEYENLDNDNSIIFLDVLYRQSSKVDYYSEIIIDDFQMDDSKAPNSTGFKLGINLRIDKKLKSFWNFEYTKINKWTYIHHGEFTSWHNSGFPLGNAYGPDVESLDFKSVISTSNRYDILIDLGYLIKGSNDIFSKWEPFSNDYDVQMEYFYNSISIIFNKRWGSLEIGYSSKNYPTIKY